MRSIPRHVAIFENSSIKINSLPREFKLTKVSDILEYCNQQVTSVLQAKRYFQSETNAGKTEAIPRKKHVSASRRATAAPRSKCCWRQQKLQLEERLAQADVEID